MTNDNNNERNTRNSDEADLRETTRLIMDRLRWAGKKAALFDDIDDDVSKVAELSMVVKHLAKVRSDLYKISSQLATEEKSDNLATMISRAKQRIADLGEKRTLMLFKSELLVEKRSLMLVKTALDLKNLDDDKNEFPTIGKKNSQKPKKR